MTPTIGTRARDASRSSLSSGSPTQTSAAAPSGEPCSTYGAGLAPGAELPGEQRHELLSARYCKWPLVGRGRSHFTHDAQERQRRQLAPAQERRRPPRAWIAWRIPIATRLLIIDEPPTETNGSGMPVIGAMPIVMPTFTNTWNRNAKTMPAATIALKRSRAPVTILRPRQTMSR